MSTQKEKKDLQFPDFNSEKNDSQKTEEAYKKFLKEHNFNEMNLPFVNFLQLVELFSMAEVGAMSKKKNTDINVSDKKEEDFMQFYIENQFTKKNTPPVIQKRINQPTVNEPAKKKQYFA